MLNTQVVITSATGQRRRLPTKQTGSWTYSEIRYGGFANFSLDVAALFTELTAIIATDIIHIYIAGVERYRGEITGRRRQKTEPSALTLTGYGRFLRAGSHIATKRYLYYGGADLSRPFSDVYHDYILPKEPGLTLAAQQVGQTTEQLDAFNQKTKDVYDSLTKLAGNQAVWGVDVNRDPNDAHYGSDELYIRPVSQAADYAIPISAIRVSSADADQQTDQLVNVITLIGGTPKFPNLLYNGGFERPVFAGAGIGNLLHNPGFESSQSGGGREHSTQNWTLGNNSSTKAGGHMEGATYAGSWMIELDGVGQYIEQIRDDCGLTVGHTLTFAGHTRREHGDDHCTAKMELFWRDASHAETLGSAILDGSVIHPVGDDWIYYYQPTVVPAGATGFRFRVTLLTLGTDDVSPGHTPGMVWDEMEVYDAQVGQQDGFAFTTFGAAEVVGQNWLNPDSYEGGYCVYVNQTSQDTDGHDLHMGMANNGRFGVSGNQEIQFGLWLKSPPGVTANAKMLLEVHSYKSDGSSSTGNPTKHIIPAGGGWTDWTFVSTTHLFPPDAVKGEVYLTFRGSGQILTDAWAVRDIGAVTGNNADFFIPDGPLQVTLRASDLMPAGSPEALSESVYGEWADIVTEASITTLPDAQAYARAIFAFKATPPLGPVVELVDDTRLFRCGQAVALIGQDGPTLSQQRALPIVKIIHRYDGQLKTTLELENEKPDQGAIILAQINKTAQLGNVAGANAYTSNASGSAASSASTSPTPPTPLATSALTGTVKTDVDQADPLVYTKATVDTLFAGKEAFLDEPTGDGYALTSTVAGVRTWVPFPVSRPAWGLAGLDSSAGGSAAFSPGDIAPTWHSTWPSATGNLNFAPGDGGNTPIAWEQRVIFSTRLKVAAAATIQIQVSVDNAARVLLNGVQIGADANVASGAVTYALALAAGWNLLQVCYQNGQGDSYSLSVQGVGGPLASLVDRMAPG